MTEDINNNNFKNWLNNNRRKIIFFLILGIITVFCCWHTCRNIKAFSQQKFHWTEEQKGTFVKIGKNHTGPYVRNIIPIGNNKYLLFSDSSCEVFDGNTYKFTLLFPDFKKYNIQDIFSTNKISDDEIEIAGYNQTKNYDYRDIKYPRYRIILNTKTLKITELPIYSYPDIQGYPELMNDVIAKTKVKISDKKDFYIGGFSVKTELVKQRPESKTKIVDYEKKQIIEGPTLNKPRNSASALLLDNNNVLVVGGAGFKYNNYLSPSEIELCNINEEKCKVIGNVPFVGTNVGPTKAFFDDLDGNLLYVPFYLFNKDNSGRNKAEIFIQTINPKTGEAKSVESFFPINEKVQVRGISIRQLKNGDLLFLGGVSGAGIGYRNDNVHKIFDIRTREIRDTKTSLNYPRSEAMNTIVLEDGNVLIVGGSKMAEVYIPE